ncbi:MAG: methylated-DNA--[protein]-cysteine S-methyltransferase [Synergistaceae bacterium]|nr:methylated-DNA--[protein]-cysteine S-methyltransferase [Synergistota bacterium]NLM71466.1 methylated-DNA--[protein]-cysteine S-methyltransferase [Synergistaceae bacterium]
MLCVRDTAIGRIAITGDGDYITHLHLPNKTELLGGFEKRESPVIREAYRQLELYLDGKLREFSLPLRAEGTVFMMKVWEELLKVPYGTVITYKELAAAAGRPRAVRAVGTANARNPIAIFIPCHRVINTGGKLGGFGGGLDLKRYLLDMEAKHS